MTQCNEAWLHHREPCGAGRHWLEPVSSMLLRLVLSVALLVFVLHLGRHPEPVARAGEGDALDLLESQSAFRVLQEVRAAHTELESRREDAARILFNTLQYQHGGTRYPLTLVQRVLDQRIEQVREIWDAAQERELELSRSLASALAFASEKRTLTDDPERAARLARAIEWLTLYVGVGHVSVRNYVPNTVEYARLEYSRRVRAANQMAGADTVEPWTRGLVSDINDYRAMIGRAADVKPWGAERFDGDSVEAVLDKAVIRRTCPLLALRISPELCEAAARHSRDAEDRGYQGLAAPPDPASGRASTTGPDGWARESGYSEDGIGAFRFSVAAGMSSTFQTLPESPGAHASMLGAYLDVGLGRCGDTWMLYLGGRYWAAGLR